MQSIFIDDYFFCLMGIGTSPLIVEGFLPAELVFCLTY